MKENEFLYAFFGKSLRNGIIVRMPDELDRAVVLLPILYKLKKIMPEYCGLFVITSVANRQLYRMVDCVDDMILLESGRTFWKKDELIQVKRLRSGVAVMLHDSFTDRLCLKFAGVPKLYSKKKIMSLLSDSREVIGNQSMLQIPCETHELCGKMPELFFHPLLLLIVPGKYEAMTDYYKKIALLWIRRGGIVAFCGSKRNFDVCEKIKKTLPPGKSFNLSGDCDVFAFAAACRKAGFCIIDDSGMRAIAVTAGGRGISIAEPQDNFMVNSDKWTIVPGRTTVRGIWQIIRKTSAEYGMPLEKYRRER